MPETAQPAPRAEVLAAVPTLFDEAGEIDHAATAGHWASLAGRVDGIFVAGTTGEFPALDRAERHALAEAALEVFGPARVVVHVGAASTRETVAITRDAVALGARRLAALTPYYLPADLDTVTRHFAATTAAAGDAAVYGYLFTERTGVTIGPSEFGRIAARAGLAGAKLSGGANARLGEYIDALPPGGRLWSGADTTLAAVVRRGGTGIVSGLSSAFPAPFVELADAVAADDGDAERAAQARADAVLHALRGSIEGIKHALALLGHGTGAMRMPSPAVPDPAAISRLVPAPGPVSVRREFLTIDDPTGMQCHASSVAVIDGDPTAAWFAGTREGTADNRIVVWRGGRAQVLDSGHEVAHWNPVLASGPGDDLWLFFKVGPRISEWVTLVSQSFDGGETWERARELVPGDTSGGRGPVKNAPLVTPAGLWLAPGSVEQWGEPARWDPFVDVSSDGGATWQRSPVPVDHAALTGAGHIQPTLWWGGAGPVALMRSTEGRAHRSTSPDGGRTWTPAAPVALPNNNSGLTAVALPSGRVACVHNPSAQDWGSRCPLVVSVSDDDGRTWRPSLVIDDGSPRPGVAQRLDPHARPGFTPGDAGVVTSGVDEYSYPSAVLDGTDLVITYTWQRRGIVLARLPIADLEA